MRLILPITLMSWCIFNVLWLVFFRDPHLLAMGVRKPLLLLLSVIVMSLAGRYASERRIRQGVYLCASILLVIMAWQEWDFSQARQRILANTDGRYTDVNRRLIIGFNNKDEIRQLSQNGIGGIFLSGRNIKGENRESLRAFLQQLQDDRRQRQLPPLIITTDQEGGPVSRLSPLLERQPALAAVMEKGGSITDYGKMQGAMLSDIGVTVNFSPVVDLKPQLPPGKLDFHSRIGTRAISADPRKVIEVARQYIDGLSEAGVTATMKHFPGLARVSADTHHFSARLSDSVTKLQTSDWKPFIELSDNTTAWIMLSHVILVQADDQNPVSTSKAVIDKLIPEKLGIRSVLVTDDLTMGATYNRGFCRSVRQAYATSVNYLLISYDYEKYYEAVRCLER